MQTLTHFHSLGRPGTTDNLLGIPIMGFHFLINCRKLNQDIQQSFACQLQVDLLIIKN